MVGCTLAGFVGLPSLLLCGALLPFLLLLLLRSLCLGFGLSRIGIGLGSSRLCSPSHRFPENVVQLAVAKFMVLVQRLCRFARRQRLVRVEERRRIDVDVFGLDAYAISNTALKLGFNIG